jgi:SAM-dependent methyltransferase
VVNACEGGAGTRIATTLLRWPTPALLAWGGAWALFAAMTAAGAAAGWALTAAALLGAAVATQGTTGWRAALICSGFPLSLAASGPAAGIAPWAWLVPLAALALVYPMRSWADAPLFPTPRGALAGLAQRVQLPAGSQVLDAGCGLGDALLELGREYPQARLVGVECSLPIAWAARWRCRGRAKVRRGDLWRVDWSAFDLVYLFQRPESMARAVAKAGAELKPGAWLASLEFEAGELRPTQVHICADRRRMWLYRAPLQAGLLESPHRPHETFEAQPGAAGLDPRRGAVSRRLRDGAADAARVRARRGRHNRGAPAAL